MTEEKTDPTTSAARKRRTRAEMREYLEGELKRIAAEEKAEVIRLVSDAHDTIEKAANLPACGAQKPPLLGLLTHLKANIAALSK